MDRLLKQLQVTELWETMKGSSDLENRVKWVLGDFKSTQIMRIQATMMSYWREVCLPRQLHRPKQVRVTTHEFKKEMESSIKWKETMLNISFESYNSFIKVSKKKN